MTAPVDAIHGAVLATALADPQVQKRLVTIQGLQGLIAKLLLRRAEISAEIAKNPLLANEAILIDRDVAEHRARQKAEAEHAAMFLPAF